MDYTPEEIAQIVQETVEETTKDLEIFLTVMQQISKILKKTGTRDLNASTTQHPLLMIFNQVYTNTLIAEDLKAQNSRIELKLDRLLATRKTERV